MREILFLSIFWKSAEKFQVLLKPDKNNRYFTWRFMVISRWMRKVSDKQCGENQNTHCMINNFFSKNCAIYEMMWKNMVEPERPQMTIWRMRFVCRPTKVKETHSEYVISIAFQLQQWLCECASMLCYIYIACLVKWFYSVLSISRPQGTHDRWMYMSLQHWWNSGYAKLKSKICSFAILCPPQMPHALAPHQTWVNK